MFYKKNDIKLTIKKCSFWISICIIWKEYLFITTRLIYPEMGLTNHFFEGNNNFKRKLGKIAYCIYSKAPFSDSLLAKYYYFFSLLTYPQHTFLAQSLLFEKKKNIKAKISKNMLYKIHVNSRKTKYISTI